MKISPNVTPEKLLIIDRISMVIDLKLSLDQGDYNFGGRLAELLEDIAPQTIPPSKRGLTIKYKIRVAPHDETKDDIDQPQADPAEIEELTEELEDDFIEPEKSPLKPTYQDTLIQL